MSTALEICASAYREANMDQTLSSFSLQDFPYSLAKGLLNKVIAEMNRAGKYWFTETATALVYSPGISSYNMTTLKIDPKAITRVVKTLNNGSVVMTPLNYSDFMRRYPASTIQTNEPNYYSRYNNIIYLNSVPDKNYGITVYHLADMGKIVSETDTLPCPESDEDVFQDGVYAYLLNRLGRADAKAAWDAWQLKVSNLLADVYNDAAMPTQMPAAF
jgi:hypothetical protein